MTREHDVLRAVIELAAVPDAGGPVTGLLHSMVAHCVDLFDISAAGVVLAEPGGHLLLASSADRVRLTDLFGLRVDEGPCVECLRTGIAVTAVDLDQSAAHWPRFAPAARRHGFAAVHAVPMRRLDEVIGCISLLRARTGELPADEKNAARALADIATITVLHRRRLDRAERLSEQLQRALRSRVVIEQAKGVLAAAGGLSMEEAFARIRRHARSRNLEIAEVAGNVVRGAIDLAVLLEARPRPAPPS